MIFCAMGFVSPSQNGSNSVILCIALLCLFQLGSSLIVLCGEENAGTIGAMVVGALSILG